MSRKKSFTSVGKPDDLGHVVVKHNPGTDVCSIVDVFWSFHDVARNTTHYCFGKLNNPWDGPSKENLVRFQLTTDHMKQIFNAEHIVETDRRVLDNNDDEPWLLSFKGLTLSRYYTRSSRNSNTWREHPNEVQLKDGYEAGRTPKEIGELPTYLLPKKKQIPKKKPKGIQKTVTVAPVGPGKTTKSSTARKKSIGNTNTVTPLENVTPVEAGELIQNTTSQNATAKIANREFLPIDTGTVNDKKKGKENKAKSSQQESSSDDEGSLEDYVRKDENLRNEDVNYEGSWNLAYKWLSATVNISFGWYDMGPSAVSIPTELEWAQCYPMRMSDEERATIGKSKIKWKNKTYKASVLFDIIFKENSGTFYFYDRGGNELHQMEVKVGRLRGGFTTRSDAQRKGEVPMSLQEFNDGVVTRTYRPWPHNKVWIDGIAGGCCVLAFYYLNPEFSKDMVDDLLQNNHEHLEIHASVKIAVTDGTYEIIRQMNARLKVSCLRRIYPTKAQPLVLSNVNNLFGDSKDTGKYLVEICEKERSIHNNVSHFVSLDTHAMEIYDPMCNKGAIAMYRNSNDHCIFLEMLERNPKDCWIVNIWRLYDKVHSSGMKRDSSNGPSMDMPEVKKKKKNYGKKYRDNKKKMMSDTISPL